MSHGHLFCQSITTFTWTSWICAKARSGCMREEFTVSRNPLQFPVAGLQLAGWMIQNQLRVAKVLSDAALSTNPFLVPAVPRKRSVKAPVKAQDAVPGTVTPKPAAKPAAPPAAKTAKTKPPATKPASTPAKAKSSPKPAAAEAVAPPKAANVKEAPKPKTAAKKAKPTTAKSRTAQTSKSSTAPTVAKTEKPKALKAAPAARPQKRDAKYVAAKRPRQPSTPPQMPARKAKSTGTE